MSLLDESLANSRELGRRPLMERVLLSRRDILKTKSVARSCNRVAIRTAKPTEGHSPVTPVPLSLQEMARQTLWGGVEGPG
jgi:hypothetical protein